MKKLVLHKTSASQQHKQYKIKYELELNPAQYEAVMHSKGAALVIAGAGTGKTRTLVYRVARLVEEGIPPESLLLLTFTRKSSREMLRRAALLLDGRCEQVSGGTFHSFANQILRRYAPLIGFERNFTILDQSDSEDVINLLRAQKGLDSSKRRFPHKQTIHAMMSSAINRCQKLADVIEIEFGQYVEETEVIENLVRDYHLYKMKNNVMDYDDLLLYIAKLMVDSPQAAADIHRKYKYLMVDEYQDTNALQHQIVCALAGASENVMAVGDDAQSIYSFRGANFENIMRFPESFRSCQVITIEENYRSTQQLLDLSNEIIKRAAYRYEKNLYTTHKFDGEKPALICAQDERMQSDFVVQQVLELRESGIDLGNIAVLFRSGFMSFDLEIELTKANIPFVKFGGMKFIETSHIKDVLAMARILVNPMDMISWMRVLLLLDGVGPRSASLIVEQIQTGKLRLSANPDLAFLSRGRNAVQNLIIFLHGLLQSNQSVGDTLARICEYYRPLLHEKHDDYAKRWKDIEMLLLIAERYETLEKLLADMAIDPPVQSVAELEPESKEEEFLTLSTIHSAKGLEWDSVFLLTALDGRFPSAKSVESVDSLEEERRLMYVACTRAKNRLYISYPMNIYDRETGFVLAHPSRFVEGIGEEILDRFVLAAEEEQTPDYYLPPDSAKNLLK